MVKFTTLQAKFKVQLGCYQKMNHQLIKKKPLTILPSQEPPKPKTQNNIQAKASELSIVVCLF